MLQYKFIRSTRLTHFLEGIDQMRTTLLCEPLSPRVVIQTTHQNRLNLLKKLLDSQDYSFSLREIDNLLVDTGNKSGKKLFVSQLSQTLNHIAWDWTGNSENVTINHVSHLYNLLTSQKLKTDHDKLNFTLSYLQASPDHPIIIASIIAAVMPTLNVYPEHNTILGFLIAQIFLAKYGYDLRYSLNLVDALALRSDDSQITLKASNNFDDLTLWLELCAKRIETQLSQLVQNEPVKPNFQILSDRQRHILDYLTNSDTFITNQKVQSLFHISQITASRELSKLNALGLISSQGAGRSVKYIKR